MNFKPISEAPKNTIIDSFGCDTHNGSHILGRSSGGEYRVCWWTEQYPISGGWVYAEVPTNYISTFLSFNPVEFCEIPNKSSGSINAGYDSFGVLS